MGFLPPPPGGSIKLPPPGGAGFSDPSSQITFQSQQQSVPSSNPQPTNMGGASNIDLLFNIDTPIPFSNPAPQLSSQNIGQNPLGGTDSDFDMLRDNSNSGSTEPMAGSTDPWGEFTGASSR